MICAVDSIKCFDKTVEPLYFESSGEMENSSKKWRFEITDSKWLKGKSTRNYFEFKITGNLK